MRSICQYVSELMPVGQLAHLRPSFCLALILLGNQGCLSDGDDYDEMFEEITNEDNSEPDHISVDDVGEKFKSLEHLCDHLGLHSDLRERLVNHGYHVAHWGVDPVYPNGGPYIIFGTDNDNTITGSDAGDIICARGGNDVVDGGLGRDRIYGEEGNDTLHGGDYGDLIHGGDGNDEIYGDLQDDKIFGDAGDDLIVGGQGTDYMYGGPGNDWLRGDTNEDAYSGGDGYDVASFITARPTGYSDSSVTRGIKINLDEKLRGRPHGDAVGNATSDDMAGIERVIGSAFDDEIEGRVHFKGIFGSDVCNEPCMRLDEALQTQALELPRVFVDLEPKVGGRNGDNGVIVLGSDDKDVFHISFEADSIVIQANSHLSPGEGCEPYPGQNKNKYICKPNGNKFQYLMAWGGNGSDQIFLEHHFPDDFTAYVDGGEGDDIIVGSDRDDVLFTGRNGFDWLDGGSGNDALISETYDGVKRDPKGGGGDILVGGPGNDQLVADNPCGGHQFYGGEGTFDIAGFGRVGKADILDKADTLDKADIWASLGESAILPGTAILKDFCDNSSGTRIEYDLEVLEGSSGDDYLYGNSRNNIIWGRGGNDHLFGEGGDDILEGHAGTDWLYGGGENDKLLGGSQNDWLYGGAGNDKLYGGAGNDNLFGGAGDDVLKGQGDNDDLLGGPGDDTLNGGTGNDHIDGGSGNDHVENDPGNDTCPDPDHC